MLRTDRALSSRLAIFLFCIFLTSCGKGPNSEETCTGGTCTEASINAPVTPPPGTPQEPDEPVPPEPPQGYRLPAFNPAWGLTKSVYLKAVRKYGQLRQQRQLGNSHFFVIVDFNLPSSKNRFFLFDLKNQRVERHLTTHGTGSDPENTGYATRFSNEPESKKSSLGLYLTREVYFGKHGRSLKLRGLEATNSNAEQRAIVMHPANYVQESVGRAGRSWGCVALDPTIANSVISRLRGGALLLVDK